VRRGLFVCVFAFFGLSVFPLPVTEEDLVINIEVPVRVFCQGDFVENLTIKDFEIFEEDKAQKVEAVYLVKKRSVERGDEEKRFTPTTSRNFFLSFDISEYSAEMGRAIDYFHMNILFPGDNLIVVTPLNTYKLQNQVMEYQSRKELADQLKRLLRKDTRIGNAQYKGAVKDLIGLAKALSAGGPSGIDSQAQGLNVYTQNNYGHSRIDQKITKYLAVLERLNKLRHVDQRKFLEFAQVLKNQKGQKYVLLIYQREYIPQVEPAIFQKYITICQDKPHILRSLYRLFDTARRDIYFDIDLVKQTFADSSVSVHFLFLTPPIQYMPRVYFQERSEDVFAAYKEMADATGGFVDSSADCAASFSRAIQASVNYYLLYYSPKDYTRNGDFKEINVKVKNKDYKIIHRMGYFAN
jgi:VWFA-related protein